ncbi:hypothetical protein HC864_01065 [Candidatus Gracilibacteria bacterium]|nr:hypothetical protein [Candidatus Gracilibacteria bacterium]
MINYFKIYFLSFISNILEFMIIFPIFYYLVGFLFQPILIRIQQIVLSEGDVVGISFISAFLFLYLISLNSILNLTNNSTFNSLILRKIYEEVDYLKLKLLLQTFLRSAVISIVFYLMFYVLGSLFVRDFSRLSITRMLILIGILFTYSFFNLLIKFNFGYKYDIYDKILNLNIKK